MGRLGRIGAALILGISLARLGTEQGGPAWEPKGSYKIFAEVLRGKSKREYKSLLPEFNKLTELFPEQWDWLVQNTSTRTLRLALKVGGAKACM